jgi:hypothetical protein
MVKTNGKWLITAFQDTESGARQSKEQNLVIRVYDEADNVIETHEHKGDFKE